MKLYEIIKGKRILVTGGAGAIGSNLVNTITSNNNVIVVDDLSSGYESNLKKSENLIFVLGSILNESVLKKAFSFRPEIVIHLAALFANQNSVDHPENDLSVNALGTLKVLQSSIKSKIIKFLYCSSSCIYGNFNKLLSEDMIASNLDTPYAISKLTGEKYVSYFCNNYGMDTVTLRFFNSFGPGEYPGKYRNVIPNFIYQALNNKPFYITGSGKETRDFNYVENTIQAILLSCIHGKQGETYNVGSGKETQIYELAKIIIELTKSRSEIKFKPRRNWDNVTMRIANISKIKKHCYYIPTINLIEQLKTTIDWLKKI